MELKEAEDTPGVSEVRFCSGVLHILNHTGEGRFHDDFLQNKQIIS